ncbi:NAD(P)H-dependent flavin oxidoreductase [Psychrobacillus vulpis]|uniref:Probable nitronate monooxygenase n=1 Tax=Psychrobacillus vulpis TaxID=2325572 RepID=A0A544TQY1_9BACI|nr:nitronate monooxygenase [Psychrobacillus vulpis]TQR19859.1 nitronate monooxygenase [Psychrobacillus vulpis]
MPVNAMLKNMKLEIPIIQAPMAGGITTSNLVAAVSNNGALGMIAAGYMSPIQLREQIREVKLLTTNNFGVNLFVPNEFHLSNTEMELANQLLLPYRDALHIHNENMSLPNVDDAFQTFKEQIQVLIEEKVPICSFTFGVPTLDMIQQLKQQGIILIGTATTVAEAIAIEDLAMDAVVVQGSEAGGHRGNFLGNHEESLIGLMSLIPQVANNVTIPVIAAGGIMDGRGLMAALCLGASAVQMGTAFLTCEESGAHSLHKKSIMESKGNDTVLTKAFSGKWARGITNKFIEEMKQHEESFPNFPVQNTLTQSIRKAASEQNNKDFMSLWSGQSTTLAKRETVQSLIKRVMDEARNINIRV